MSVEAIGSVHLKHGDNTYNGAPQYYIVDGSNAPIALTNAGASSGPTSYAGWSATQVIAASGAHMRYFGLILVENMKSGRSIPKATSSRIIKLSYGKMKLSLALISMGMVAQV